MEALEYIMDAVRGSEYNIPDLKANQNFVNNLINNTVNSLKSMGC